MLFPTPVHGLWLSIPPLKVHSIFLIKQCQQSCQLDWLHMEKEPDRKSAENDPFSTKLASEELTFPYCVVAHILVALILATKIWS